MPVLPRSNTGTAAIGDRYHVVSECEALAAFTARQAGERIGNARERAKLAPYLACDDRASSTGAVDIIGGAWVNAVRDPLC